MHAQTSNTPGPIQSPETLTADMWKNCPALCRSIGQNFDLNTIFHPSLIAQHGETFLRLAVNQIAMHNRAAEMRQMHTVILQKQKLLEVNTASTKDMQQILMTQQSEWKEIRNLLEHQSQSLTNPDDVDDGQAPGNNFKESPAATKDVTVSPTTPALTIAAIDRPIHDFYSLSASLPPLKVSLSPDQVDQYEEKHGYGHAETQGPVLQYDRSVCSSCAGLHPDQLRAVPPSVSTSPIFEPLGPSAKPIVSIGAKKQRAKSPGNRGRTEGAETTAVERQAPSLKDKSVSAGITIMRGEGTHEYASQTLPEPSETTNTNTVKQERAITHETPLSTNKAEKLPQEKVLAVPPSKPVSHAAAVRTTPTTPSKVEPSTLKQTPTTSQNSPDPDLGFKLEPLPKPIVQQVQSQQRRQQVAPAEKSDNFQSPNSSSFNFAEWKQRKIAAGTWQDRAIISNAQ